MAQHRFASITVPRARSVTDDHRPPAWRCSNSGLHRRPPTQVTPARRAGRPMPHRATSEGSSCPGLIQWGGEQAVEGAPWGLENWPTARVARRLPAQDRGDAERGPTAERSLGVHRQAAWAGVERRLFRPRLTVSREPTIDVIVPRRAAWPTWRIGCGLASGRWRCTRR
jgi:hypothetical protein